MVDDGDDINDDDDDNLFGCEYLRLSFSLVLSLSLSLSRREGEETSQLVWGKEPSGRQNLSE